MKTGKIEGRLFAPANGYLSKLFGLMRLLNAITVGSVAFAYQPSSTSSKNKVPHIWHVDLDRHEFSVWRNDLYLFSQSLFK